MSISEKKSESQSWIKRWLGPVIALLVVLVVQIQLYLGPALTSAWGPEPTTMLGNGGDSLVVPQHHWVIASTWKNHPERMLFGSIYSEQFNAPEGFGLWIPWIDRIVVGAVTQLGGVAVENSVAVYGAILMILAGFCFFLWARALGWHWALSIALASCWAVNSYVRARLIIHPALMAIYFIPLLFLALEWMRSSDRRKHWGASIALVLAVCTAHYYLLIVAALTPLWIAYVLRGKWKLPKAELVALIRRAIVIALPAVLFLAWNAKMVIAPEHQQPTAVRPTNPQSYFLVMFATKISDYLAHDLSLGAGDLNPVRGWLNRGILNNMRESNAWERSNGIRWSLLIFAFLALRFARNQKKQRDPTSGDASLIRYFGWFALIALLCSLSPRILAPGGVGIGPSVWINTLFPDFRVPTRVGPFVHFAILTLAGFWLAAQIELRKFSTFQIYALSVGLLALFAVDYSPVQAMPQVAVRSSLEGMAREGEKCGRGLFIPLLAGEGLGYDDWELYRNYQALRRTDCQMIGHDINNSKNAKLGQLWGRGAWDQAQANHEITTKSASLLQFANCAGVDWISFQNSMTPAERDLICSTLGFERRGDLGCRRPASQIASPRPMPKNLESCW